MRENKGGIKMELNGNTKIEYLFRKNDADAHILCNGLVNL